MARKRSLAAAPRITFKSVEAELKKNDYAKALELAGQLVETEPTAEHVVGYARTLSDCIDGYLRQNKVKAASETIRLAEAFAAKQESSRPTIAAVLAKCGEFGKALALADTPATRMHVADLCMRRNRADGAPQEIKSDFAIVQAAFRDYDAARDDAARDALGKIGLASAFLNWKLLLRGLIAYAANDPSRTAENWQRLAPDSLPARLAAPLRCRVDPAFRKSLPADRATAYDRESDDLASGGLVGELRELQKHTGRDFALSRIWSPVEKLLPKLRATQPALVTKLAAALYHLVLRQGSPHDLESYRRLFAAPADDPNYHRLRARACESSNELDYAVESWLDYEKWLATAPAGWPADLLARARAIVLHRVGGLIEDMNIADQLPAELRRKLDKLFGEPEGPANFGNPDDYYRKSLDLAPDWSDPAIDLCDRLLRQERWAAAERVAVDALGRHPDDLELLDKLSMALQKQDRHDERLAIVKRTVAVNPLDITRELELVRSYVAAARSHLIRADYEACERILGEAGAARETKFVGSFGSLRAILARCRKRTDEAAAIEASLFAIPGQGAAALLTISVIGAMAGLKPAQRKAVGDHLNGLFAQRNPNPLDPLTLLQLLTNWEQEGVEFTSRASVKKKIVALAERSVNAEGDESIFESIMKLLLFGAHYKSVIAMAQPLAARFPKSPIFPLMEIQSVILKSPKRRPQYAMVNRLYQVRNLTETSNRPDRDELLNMIDSLIGTVDPFGGRFPFSGPFGGPFDGDDD